MPALISRADSSFLRHLEERSTSQGLDDFKIGIAALQAGFRSEEPIAALQN
jgi:hypothetical protein